MLHVFFLAAYIVSGLLLQRSEESCRRRVVCQPVLLILAVAIRLVCFFAKMLTNEMTPMLSEAGWSLQQTNTISTLNTAIHPPPSVVQTESKRRKLLSEYKAAVRQRTAAAPAGDVDDSGAAVLQRQRCQGGGGEGEEGVSRLCEEEVWFRDALKNANAEHFKSWLMILKVRWFRLAMPFCVCAPVSVDAACGEVGKGLRTVCDT